MSYDEDLQTRAMGGISPSGTGNSITFFQNPAGVYFYNQTQKFVLQTTFFDTHGSDDFIFFEQPEINIKGLFIGSRIALGLGADSYASDLNIISSELRNYTNFRRFDIALSAAYGYKNFAIGGTVYGGSYSHKPNVEIEKDKAFSHLISKAFFAEHTRVVNSEFVDIRFGMMCKLDSMSISVKSDKTLSYTGSQKDLSFKDALDTTCFGIYFNRDRYRRRGRLNNWVFTAGVEGNNVFDKDSAQFCAGAEVGLQLSRDYTVSLRFGYNSMMKNMDDGSVTFGVGSRLGKIDIGLMCEMPMDYLKGNSKELRMGLGFSYLI